MSSQREAAVALDPKIPACMLPTSKLQAVDARWNPQTAPASPLDAFEACSRVQVAPPLRLRPVDEELEEREVPPRPPKPPPCGEV
jgi:hypothetical protein